MFWINNVKMPTPDKEGIRITKNKLWSSKAGRTASGKYVGDIIAIKLSISINYSRRLSASEIKLIDEAVHSDAFMSVKVLKPGTSTEYITKTCYVADVEYGLYQVKNGVADYEGVSLNFVEQ
ncbi:MAG: hypothetical protein IJ031_07780 [Oscillospiraceae bacterium]|nr:hypothetical protein [Oscillospiraceae bacterium]MBQ8378499.1 hypothetical protein [Oscillospiraceae bacterium]MBQ8884468.1 hypothetical protein [Oscillospiraceae bacterium]